MTPLVRHHARRQRKNSFFDDIQFLEEKKYYQKYKLTSARAKISRKIKPINYLANSKKWITHLQQSRRTGPNASQCDKASKRQLQWTQKAKVERGGANTRWWKRAQVPLARYSRGIFENYI